MKILVLKSSPHKHGASNLLADEFIRGAQENGHEVSVYDAAHGNISPCMACDACGMGGRCVQKDDMENLKDAISVAELVVFVTPLYYFGMSAQLKKVIDRFYSFNGELMARGLKTALIAAEADNSESTFDCLKSHYKKICDYLHFRDQGIILGVGCGTASMTERMVYPQKAYELGKNLK